MANLRRSRKSGYTLRSGVMRRETSWFGLSAGNTTFTAVGGTILFSLNAAALADRPFTIVRTHIELLIRSDQTANSEDQVGAYGVAVVSDQALAIGVTAVPTPNADVNSDLWFLHQWLMNSIQVSSATSVFQAQNNYTVDSRAMRKVEEGQDVVGVAEFSAQGAGFVLIDAGRMLVKLH